jgi:hypothetical protein
MLFDQQYHEELRALRNLEKAVRACMTSRGESAERHLENVAHALNQVVEARKSTIQKSLPKKA